MIERSAGSIHCFDEEAQVQRIDLPVGATASLKALWSPFATWQAAPRFLARLSLGRVFGSGNILSPDGSTIARDVSPDHGKAFSEHWLLGYRNIRPPQKLDGVSAVAALPLGDGYSHWLLEELPRLLALRSTEFDHVFAHGEHAYQQLALSMAGVGNRRVIRPRYSHYWSDEVLIPSVPSQTGPDRWVPDELAGFVAPLITPSGRLPERIYVSRGDAHRRRVANEDLLWSKLAPLGFARVHLGDLAWPEQIALFQQARVVVAPHGAGLANLVFLQPGARVIELLHRDYANPGYWRWAALRGLEYIPIVKDADLGVALALRSNRLDLTVDVDAVCAAVLQS